MQLHILGLRLDAESYATTIRKVASWARRAESRAVVAANVHTVMAAFDDASVRAAVNAADVVAPDGMPLVWLMRFKGVRAQSRVYGPWLMLQTLQAAARMKIPVGLYGSSVKVLSALENGLAKEFPGLCVVFRESPPFGDLELLGQDGASDRIAASGARILFVGLGCPKQERWMAAHRGRIPAVMIGVGAAFDFLAGTKRMAPGWMQSIGVEWLFRLLSEPRRLWKRYLFHNSRFMVLAAADLLGVWRRKC